MRQTRSRPIYPGNVHWMLIKKSFLLQDLVGADVAVIPYLVGQGFGVDVTDTQGDTALHIACWLGDMDKAVFLLSRKATPDAQNSEGQRPEDLLWKHDQQTRARFIQLLHPE